MIAERALSAARGEQLENSEEKRVNGEEKKTGTDELEVEKDWKMARL